MEKDSAASAHQQLRTLYAFGTLGTLPDARLLELFLDPKGMGAEDAFAALVQRHGPMVLGVCRRMLACAQDRDDVFQATFLVLARRAGAIGRRESLAAWLHGVATRTAREARRRLARQRVAEKRLMAASRVEPDQRADSSELIALVDEEVRALPDRYRKALVACELQGKSRSDAARELGVPEGTLSAHLARGKKRLRERLLRRGVGLGLGLAAIEGVTETLAEAAIPERLFRPTVQAAFGFLSTSRGGGTVPAAIASLANQVLRAMFFKRLSLFLTSALASGAGAAAVAAVVLGLSGQADEPPVAETKPTVTEKPKPDDLPGRVIDRAGQGVAGTRVWLLGGPWLERVTIDQATTDGQGRFLVPNGLKRKANAEGNGAPLTLFARAPDGRVGWLENLGRPADDRSPFEVELGPVGEVRGRVVDENQRPLAGVSVAARVFSRPSDAGWSSSISLSPEVAASYRATTGADGSYVLQGVPQGALVQATVTPKGGGSRVPQFSWNSAQAATLTVDSRVGKILGHLRPPDGQRLAGRITVSLSYTGALADARLGPAQVLHNASAVIDPSGEFTFDGLEPGKYQVRVWFDDDARFTAGDIKDLEVGPNGTTRLNIPLTPLLHVNGRVINSQTGVGINGISVSSYRLENQSISDRRDATTDHDGRYAVKAQAGTVLIRPEGLPSGYVMTSGTKPPSLKVESDTTCPDLKLTPASTLNVKVVDASGQPAANAEVFLLDWDRPGVPYRKEPVRTGPDGTVRLEQFDPDDTVALWARSAEATSGETVVVCPTTVHGQVSIAVDPRRSLRIRGRIAGRNGKPVTGAKVSLWWTRPYASKEEQSRLMSVGKTLAWATVGDDGRFDFPGLWPGMSYSLNVTARGHTRLETPNLSGKAGETLDVGNLRLLRNDGRLAGRVVGSNGRPIVGAEVFNRGDCLGRVATSTDGQGRFQLTGLLPGPKYAFVRIDGYRFTGVQARDEADSLTITLLRNDEPPPLWKPAAPPRFENQRDFARRTLIRLWERFGADANNNGAIACIMQMAAIDRELALAWSAQQGGRLDAPVNRLAAVELAETDGPGALAILRGMPGRPAQNSLQQLAVHFEKVDAAKARAFAEEAAVQARMLEPPHRAAAMAQAGAALARLGRVKEGRALIDEAAGAASAFALDGREAYYRGLIAQALAPFDKARALALIEPVTGKERDRYFAMVATAIAGKDTAAAVALLDKVGGLAFYHELARTEIAYTIGADRPDEAIAIIEGITRWPQWQAQWQAEAFGWLAVALAPRDRARAFRLIDRALDMMLDQRDGARMSGVSGGSMASAVRIAECARRIGYPDMDSVVMRVMAARPAGSAEASAQTIQATATAAVELAMLDPGAARTLLEQVEERGGPEPISLWNTRGPWLTAWGLVDPAKAEVEFEAALTTLGDPKQVKLWSTGLLSMAELLATPPDRRESSLQIHRSGGSWHPGAPL